MFPITSTVRNTTHSYLICEKRKLQDINLWLWLVRGTNAYLSITPIVFHFCTFSSYLFLFIRAKLLTVLSIVYYSLKLFFQSLDYLQPPPAYEDKKTGSMQTTVV